MLGETGRILPNRIRIRSDWEGYGPPRIYKDLSPDFQDQVKAEDLVFSKEENKGIYNTHNKWTERTDTGTIVHLIQRNNALSAEVDIGAQVTILRKDLSNGKLITNLIELGDNASAYGNAKRNSDPTVRRPHVALNTCYCGFVPNWQCDRYPCSRRYSHIIH